jgi:RNA polymerase-binding transcription factor DksA
VSDISIDEPTADTPSNTTLDLDGVESDLDGVEAALARLADDTYWTDEVTGEPIADDVLAADPLTRRTPSGTAQDT